MSRILARELTFKLVYENLFLKIKNNLTLNNFMVSEELSEDDKLYINTVYDDIIENESSLIEKIKNNLEKFNVDRLYKIDLAILILATYELLHNKDITTAIIINEAVELAKKYSTEKSPGFVNGVLAKIALLRENDGK